MPELFLKKRIEKREKGGILRSLTLPSALIDFASNDYLGLARSSKLKAALQDELSKLSSLGSTGSRLLTGNTSYSEELEKRLAIYFEAEAGLLFQTGYLANLALLSTIPIRGEIVLFDEEIHASSRDGMALSKANCIPFLHNDLDDLEKKLHRAKKRTYIVVEGLYSASGTLAPLRALGELASRYNAHLIVDEAHATSLFPKGLSAESGIENSVFARIVTFGKAFGISGGLVIGSALLQKTLINFASSFIYTTAPTNISLVSIEKAFECYLTSHHLQKRLISHCKVFDSPTPVIFKPLFSAKKSRECAAFLQQKGFDVRPLFYPTTKKGKEGLRIILHAFNTEDELKALKEFL